MHSAVAALTRHQVNVGNLPEPRPCHWPIYIYMYSQTAILLLPAPAIRRKCDEAGA